MSCLALSRSVRKKFYVAQQVVVDSTHPINPKP